MGSRRTPSLVLTVILASLAGCQFLPLEERSSKPTGMTLQKIKSACEKAPSETSEDPRTGKYRTILSFEMKEEPNFAGCWRVIEVGCGTSCQQIVLLHPETETVLWGPTASYGARYKLNSNILVINPPDVLKENNAESLEWTKTRKYRFDHESASLNPFASQ